MDRSELFWRLYVNDREFLRHYDSQRTLSSNLVAAIASAVIVISFKPDLTPMQDLTLGGLVSLLGMIGYFQSRKIYSEILRHALRSHRYLEFSCESIGHGCHEQILDMKKEIETLTDGRKGSLSKVPLNFIWLSLIHI